MSPRRKRSSIKSSKKQLNDDQLEETDPDEDEDKELELDDDEDYHLEEDSKVDEEDLEENNEPVWEEGICEGCGYQGSRLPKRVCYGCDAEGCPDCMPAGEECPECGDEDFEE